MRKFLVSLCAVAGTLLAGSAAQATSISWDYSADTTTIFSGPSQTSSITFAGQSGTITAEGGSSGAIIYNLTSASTATTSAADSFSNVPFTLSLHVTDKTSGVSGTFTFNGSFNATNVTASSLLPGPVTVGASDPQFVQLGALFYTATVLPVVPPGQPGGAPGAIAVVVSVSPNQPGGTGQPPPQAPEPTSLVLAGLAVPALLMARRRRKQAEVA